jgi:hypothetical protein
MEVMEMKCMRAMCGVSIMDRIINDDVGRQCGSEVSIRERMDINILRWYGHVERLEEERMVKSVYCAKVEGSRARRRPKMRWMDSVKARVERKGMDDEEAKGARKIVVNGGGWYIPDLLQFV